MAFYNPSQIFQESETRVIGKSTLLPSMDQFDVNLHELIQRNHVIQPTPRALPYSLSHPSKDPSMGQGQSIRNLFKNMVRKDRGFKIEEIVFHTLHICLYYSLEKSCNCPMQNQTCKRH